MSFPITEAVLSSQGSIKGTFLTTSLFVRNTDNDITFYCGYIPIGENLDNGIGVLAAIGSISGKVHSGNLGNGLLEGVGSISGKAIRGTTPQPGNLAATGNISAYWYTQHFGNNLVGWSKIGDTRILLDESNEAGYKYLTGSKVGLVHRILSFGSQVPVVYGSSSITVMKAVSKPYATFGFKPISDIGILGMGSVCGDEDVHFYINKNKELCVLDANLSPKILGYSEFIDAISPGGELVLMFYDGLNKRVYISSTIGGLIYTESGMGGGFANLTAADGVVFASPDALDPITQEICTDILDMDYRGIKTLQEVMIGTDLSNDLSVAIDARYDKAGSFVTSPWKICNKEGVVFPIVSGVEFRIRVKSSAFEDFEIDYISARFKFSDKRFNRSAYKVGKQSRLL